MCGRPRCLGPTSSLRPTRPAAATPAAPRPWAMAARDANGSATLSAGAILAGNEHVKVGKLRKRIWRLTEVGGQHIDRVARNPLRQVYRLIGASVEPNQDPALFIAHIFNRVSVPLRNVGNISLLQGLDAEPPVRPKQCDAHLTVDNVLPLVGIGMPMQLA